MARPKGKQWTSWELSEPTVHVAGRNTTVLCKNSYYVVLLTRMDNVEKDLSTMQSLLVIKEQLRVEFNKYNEGRE